MVVSLDPERNILIMHIEILMIDGDFYFLYFFKGSTQNIDLVVFMEEGMKVH